MNKHKFRNSDIKFEKMSKRDRHETDDCHKDKYAAGGAAKVRLKMASKDGKPLKACHRDDR
jgi:hypothetical protein